MLKKSIRNLKICVVGLGYVGLPLAIEISKKRKLICYDKNVNRVKNLKKGFDTNFEISKKRQQFKCIIYLTIYLAFMYHRIKFKYVLCT